MRGTTKQVLQCVFSVGVVLGASVPVYDQRQEGKTNVHAQLENVVVLLVPPAGTGLMDLVGLAAKSVGLGVGKQNGDLKETTRDEAVNSRQGTTIHADERLQRDPDYSQVPKEILSSLPSLPHLPHVVLEDGSSEESSRDPEDLQPTSTEPTTSSAAPASATPEPAEPTPVVVKDAVTAHSPKLALYSQFRSASAPHYKKQNRRTR